MLSSIDNKYLDKYPADNLTTSTNVNVDMTITNDLRSIPILVGNRPPNKFNCSQRILNNNVTIRRDNKVVKALSLPTVWSANHRSIWPRLANTIDELIELEAHVAFHCEHWQNSDNKNKQYQLKKAYELKGVSYISTPRSDRTGGGAAITLLSESPFTLTQLFPANPQKLEVCRGLLKLKNVTGELRSILLCSFYNLPNSRKQRALLDHISEIYYKNKSHVMGFMCAGDRNGIRIADFLQISNTFRQIVTQPTYNKEKILDICVTDLGAFYGEPELRQPIIPNDPSRKPSDHNPWIVRPWNANGN